MPNPKTTERLRSLVLSATDLGDMTDWPEALIEDYLNTLDNLITIADLLDIEIDKLIEETPTDFAVGSIPFKGDEFLVEDNTNLTWDNGTKVLTMANALVLGLLTALNVVVTGLLTAADAVITGVLTLSNTGLHILDTDASHDLIIKPGSDLTADRTYTITTGDSDRTITLQGNPLLDDWFDQALKEASTPIFAGVTLGNTGLHILDTDASHDLIIKPGSDLTADRTLTIITGDADRTLTIEADITLEDWFDQAVKTTSSPIFAGVTLGNAGLHILDTDSSHDLIIKPGSDLTADRTLTVTTGDASRAITLSGNPTMGDWFDQPVKSTSGVIFNMVGIGTTSPSEKLDVNGDAIRIRSPQTPATAAATGTAGMICWDASYIYVCVATNTWKRTALATW